jgi:hypothetical protein
MSYCNYTLPLHHTEQETYNKTTLTLLNLRKSLFTTVSRQALRPTQPPVQWVPGALSLGVKRPGREADHSPPSSAEVKNAWSYTSTPARVFTVWCLIKHRDIFTFTATKLTGKCGKSAATFISIHPLQIPPFYTIYHTQLYKRDEVAQSV